MIQPINLGSVLLGLLAWILPIISIVNYKRFDNQKFFTLSIISFSSCVISIYFQFLNYRHLVNISDWIAILDTIDTIIGISLILIITTIVLNTITLFISKKDCKIND